MDDVKYALLIDSDNISAHYISAILDELTQYGTPTYKRIYGDWTSPQAAKWKRELLTNSITPIQQFSNTTGKNATDSALIIDAMDILYENRVDGFCIVSSDSDFTRLASRLRESGMQVIGMGENKTPLAFRNACTKFVSLENLMEVNAGDDAMTLSQPAVESAIADFITNNENRGRETNLSQIGERLSNKYPDFDVRSFGYSSLAKFIEEMPRFDVTRNGPSITVRIASNRATRDAAIGFIVKTVSEHDQRSIGLSELGNLVHRAYPNFNLRDYGYSQFHKLVQSIEGIEVFGHSNSKRVRVSNR